MNGNINIDELRDKYLKFIETLSLRLDEKDNLIEQLNINDHTVKSYNNHVKDLINQLFIKAIKNKNFKLISKLTIFNPLIHLKCFINQLNNYTNNIRNCVNHNENDTDDKKYNCIQNVINEMFIFYVKENNIDCIKLCVELGITINIDTIPFDEHSALYQAYEANNKDMINFLINHGANESLLKDEFLIDAAYISNLEEIKKLINEGANINANDNKAIEWAVRHSDIKLIELLFSYGASKNKALEIAKKYDNIFILNHFKKIGLN